MRHQRVLLSAIAAAATLGGLACIGDGPLAPDAHGPVRLRMRADVVGAAGAAASTIEIGVFYRRAGGGAVSLAATPARVSLESGTTLQQAVTVQVEPCLVDGDRLPANTPGRRLGVTLRLLDGAGAVTDTTTTEAEGAPATPGQTVELGTVTVGRLVASVSVSPSPVALEPGQTRALTALAADAQTVTAL